MVSLFLPSKTLLYLICFSCFVMILFATTVSLRLIASSCTRFRRELGCCLDWALFGAVPGTLKQPFSTFVQRGNHAWNLMSASKA